MIDEQKAHGDGEWGEDEAFAEVVRSPFRNHLLREFVDGVFSHKGLRRNCLLPNNLRTFLNDTRKWTPCVTIYNISARLARNEATNCSMTVA